MDLGPRPVCWQEIRVRPLLVLLLALTPQDCVPTTRSSAAAFLSDSIEYLGPRLISQEKQEVEWLTNPLYQPKEHIYQTKNPLYGPRDPLYQPENPLYQPQDLVSYPPDRPLPSLPTCSLDNGQCYCCQNTMII